MVTSASLILFLALILDWWFGEPEILWARIPHPVVLFGKAIEFLDQRFNRESDLKETKYRAGAVSVAGLVLLSGLVAYGLSAMFARFGIFGSVAECFLVFTLLAQRSLFDHVKDVGCSLYENGLDAAREKLGLIVGRDPKLLQEAGVCRASIETLAENFSDGVVAPAFWYLVFGLPGIFVYKVINTADSMIGYKNKNYLYYGKVAAQLDDLANWLPARISAGLIGLAAAFVGGVTAGKRSIAVAVTQAGLHRSPNAGWPEAAMAGGLDVALGGPRVYPDETVPQAFINGTGKRELSAGDILRALGVFNVACYVLWGIVLLFWLFNPA